MAQAWNFDDIGCVKERGPSDDVLFRELKEVLERHGATHRFGITLLHTHFDVAPNEVMMEYTDITTRTQLLRPVTLAEAEAQHHIETAWSLEGDAPTMRCTCQKSNGDHGHWETN